MTGFPLVVVTDRGGHLQNALMLVEQMEVRPSAFLTTHGPDIDFLRKSAGNVFEIPYLFSWWGKKRWFNPLAALWHFVSAFRLAAKLRPEVVVSLGASNVILFCYCARLFGAKIVHVECMNQVVSPSVTGKFLYPVCSKLFVQWPELLRCFGPKAQYEGWVL